MTIGVQRGEGRIDLITWMSVVFLLVRCMVMITSNGLIP